MWLVNVAFGQEILDRLETRNASGTAWQPDTAPMHGFAGEAGALRWMAHANAFGMYDWQAGEGGELGSVNWVMGRVAARPGAADLGARVMVSLEPLTLGGDGYPLVGQTGETWGGEPLVDRQHPHDLLMEVALQYRQAVGEHVATELYVAPAGEPALGPAAFPHRASAIADPVAPLGHHWQDSSHISHGVVTAGVATSFGKIEGSWFNGREPDEGRYDLDVRVPDSWSARATLNPVEALSAQVSYGWLASPETLAPDRPLTRVTASLTYDHAMRGQGNWATTAAWGRNVEGEHATDSALVESTLSAGRHVNLFGRAEYVVKAAEDFGRAGEATYGLASVGLGHVYTVEALPGWATGLGVRGSVTRVPPELERAYGTRTPLGAIVYLQLRPREMEHKEPGEGRGH
ncbi:MAG: hypothetical protein ACOZNI_37775 [Myxococcota bacterium]